MADYVEIDKYACKSYNAINGTNFKPQDIKEWDKDISVDLIMHGSPCFLAGTKVLTNSGYKNIEDLKIGDMVLTHKNRFRRVENIGMNQDKNIFSLKAQGGLKTYVTENHPYYVREMKRVWNNKLKRDERQFSEPKWKEVKDLKNNDFVGINIPTKEENIYNLDEEVCWLLGRYVADGHIRYNKRKGRKNSYQYGVVYSLGNNKVENFKEHLKKYHASIYPHTQSCHRAVISSMKLVDFIILNNFGREAIEKDIPNFILELPVPLAKSFLNGYISGDGCFTNNSYKASTISENLILKLQLLIAKVYNTSSNIYFCKRATKHIIQGRVVNQHDSYSIDFNKEIRKQNNSYVDLENNIIWYPIKKIEDTNKRDKVYNITVEEDNSYTANNFIVHNCQDYSISGLQAGGDEGSGTRSSLMYESIRIINKLKPKYVVWENVKNLLSKKHKHNFDNYINKLDELGYNSYYQVLDAKNYNVPQHRERVYTISIRKDIDEGNFKFPEKEPLKIVLKDLLEKEVDEKYYLNDKQLISLKNSTFNARKTRIQEKKYCDTLCARDFKDPKCIQIGNLDIKGHESMKRVYSPEGISPTLTTMEGGNLQPKVLTYTSKKYNNFIKDKGYFPEMFNPYHTKEIKDISPTQTANCGSTPSSASVLINTKPEIEVIGNYMPSGHDASRVVNSNGLAPTVKENHGTVTATNIGTSVRKLTPLECWRLMSFDDEDFYKAQNTGISNSQLYKQAGNSIVVKVLEKIFLNLFKNKEE